ncbi:alpha/beta hydrolase [Galactobacter caseinivorans]|uniref:alpha/beta hydrolase n=1 Tax=Galactobacter caseinivorans TaxID=2676123 RepID=UPI001314A587|nr:alpha/beta hydrolase [Galactobacter caseinivorans]
MTPRSTYQPTQPTASRSPRRGLALTALVASAALVLSACSPGSEAAPTSGGQGSASASPASSAPAPEHADQGKVPPGLEKIYSQQPRWTACEETECATIKVPLDYSKPTGETIDLALARTTGGQKKGSLVLNPGGPGGSGIDMVQRSASVLISDSVRDQYQIVGFDPRGVGKSSAVKCLSDAEMDKERETAVVPTNDAGIERSVAQARTYGTECHKNSPAGLLSHVDTTSSARDLDVVRQILGRDKLDYLGFSYGTKLGATYMSLFPQNAGRMVLDGAVDPSLGGEEVALQQAKAFEKSLDKYLQNCLDSDSCPFKGDAAQARTALTDFVASADTRPLKAADGRRVPAADIVSALMMPMYEPQFEPMLNSALAQAMGDENPTELLAMADLSAERGADGAYANNMQAAFTAINCADYSRGSDRVSSIMASARTMEKAAPFFGRYMAYDDGCATWPVPQVKQADTFQVSQDVAPALVVGTTGDPATPYAWAQSLNKQLPGSVLLTYKGWGHTAYGRSNDCVANAVDDYLLQDKLPASGASC